MTLEELTLELDNCATVSDALRIRSVVDALPSAVAFHLLFTLATRDVGKPNLFAAALLIELEPPCPVDCEVALRTLGSGCWQVSDHKVPFYLITQFGKLRLIEAVAIVSNEFDGERRHQVNTVAYHAQWPAAEMSISTLTETFARIERNATNRS